MGYREEDSQGGGIYTVSPLHVLIILIQSDVGGTHAAA